MLEAVRSKLNDWSTSDNFSDVVFCRVVTPTFGHLIIAHIFSDLEIGLFNQRGVLLLSMRGIFATINAWNILSTGLTDYSILRYVHCQSIFLCILTFPLGRTAIICVLLFAQETRGLIW